MLLEELGQMSLAVAEPSVLEEREVACCCLPVGLVDRVGQVVEGLSQLFEKVGAGAPLCQAKTSLQRLLEKVSREEEEEGQT